MSLWLVAENVPPQTHCLMPNMILQNTHKFIICCDVVMECCDGMKSRINKPGQLPTISLQNTETIPHYLVLKPLEQYNTQTLIPLSRAHNLQWQRHMKNHGKSTSSRRTTSMRHTQFTNFILSPSHDKTKDVSHYFDGSLQRTKLSHHHLISGHAYRFVLL